MTETEYENQYAPPDKKWMITFTSVHKLIGGTESWQSQRRFILADSANEAREHFRLGELAQPQWTNGFHRWENLQAYPVPNAAAWTLGYNRFALDIRKVLTP